jgi:hypothetical protein
MEPTDKKLYSSQAQLCKAKKLDKKLVRAASALGLPGFNSNRTVNWELLEPSLKEHDVEIQAYLKDKSFDDLRREEKELGNELKRLEIKKREGSYVDPAEWYQWHSEFGSKLSSNINGVRKHLMAKCVGYESVIDTEMLSLFTLINTEVQKCKEQ